MGRVYFVPLLYNLKLIIMKKFNNGDLAWEFDKIVSFDVPITVSKAFDDNLDYPYAIDVEDESFFYINAKDRDEDFEILKLLVPKFSFVEL